jgi:hypothetical protein
VLKNIVACSKRKMVEGYRLIADLQMMNTMVWNVVVVKIEGPLQTEEVHNQGAACISRIDYLNP